MITHLPVIRLARWTAGALVAGLLGSANVHAQAPAHAPTPPRGSAPPAAGPAVNPQAAALAEFQQRLQAYIDLRAQLSNKLRPLTSTNDSAELAARQDTLAAAIRDARKGAKPGDVIPTRVSGQIRNIIADDFRRRNPEVKRAVFEEVPEKTQPVINNKMPDTAALATVPPLLLNNLPRLPDNLQYRFMGRHVVLIDGDTRVIVDYILNVLPPH